MARRRARRWAAELVRASGWIVLDTETTGTRGDAQVLQVAVVHPSGATLYEACARPEGDIPADAVAIHGLTTELLESALPFRVVHDGLRELLTGRRVVSYNAPFDARLLSQTARRHSLEPLAVDWDCAMRAYAAFVGEWDPERSDFRWHRLPGAAHGAAADCRATIDLIRRMAEPPGRRWWVWW